MSEVLISRIIGAMIQSTTVFIFIRSLLKEQSTVEKISFKGMICFTILTILIFGLYSVEYNTINPIAIFLAIVFGLFIAYKMNISRAFLYAGTFMVFLFFADMVTSIIYVNFFDAKAVREIPISFILSNLSVGIITIILIKIKLIRNKTLEIIFINENKESTETITFIVLLLSALSLIFYLISRNYTLNKIYIVAIIGILIFIILTFIFFKEKYEKETIINKYDELFEYVRTFEEWIDTESMNIHESKNQLATLRDIVKRNKKAVQYIDEIIKERINVESKSTEKLKYLPKGGLKGLLYYKIVIAESNNIILWIDVSKNSDIVLKKLKPEENKMLCRLVGIFFDNAIESAKESEKKMISCEIYINNKNLNIIISNTFSGNIDLNKITEKGYSTKGKNRGKGLYLAKKFSARYERFSLENRIINDYYVQKIIIKEI